MCKTSPAASSPLRGNVEKASSGLCKLSCETHSLNLKTHALFMSLSEIVLPLYPQYSGATTGSTFDALAADFTRRRWLPELRFVSHYHDKEVYITALADSIRACRSEHGTADKLPFSYHGVPRRYLEEGDPYHCEYLKTSHLVAQELGLTEADYLVTFQSRFGREEWL